MKPIAALSPLALVAGSLALAAAPLRAEEPDSAEAGSAAQPQPQPAAQDAPGAARQAGAPPSVFDETWVSVGLGAGLVPSYAGSDDYVVFPLPLVIGRVGGVGIRPNGAGLTLDLLSPPPTPPGQGTRKTRLSLGPAFRLRNDRNSRIKDEVVALASKRDVALELGVDAGVSIPGVINPYDSVTLGIQVRRDVLGAHDGVIVEPQVGYSTPLSRGTLVNLQAGLEFVSDRFADYYFTIDPADSAATGLPEFRAKGGLNRAGIVTILAQDLDGNALNGGWSIFAVGGYSRLLGDAADTPYTAERGSADQFLAGLGLGYTF
ncbi:MAG: MipA/OmpV family protein [Porphyrobacter sp.]|nr:MipA/OmpV family protein [Porphyrobacter sp.]